MSAVDKEALDHASGDIKTLGVNALLKTSQTLTDAEKTQVKKNIGISEGYRFEEVNLSSSTKDNKNMINVVVQIGDLSGMPVMMMVYCSFKSSSSQAINVTLPMFRSGTEIAYIGNVWSFGAIEVKVTDTDFTESVLRFTISLMLGTNMDGYTLTVNSVGLLCG